jgi:hypothetical protein
MSCTHTATQRIREFLGCDSLAELIQQEHHQLTDSVMDGFCASCGAYFGQVEPDGRNCHCEECGRNNVSSLLCLIGVC